MPKSYFSSHPKKALFFDLNRTLIDDKGSKRACFVSVLNEFTGRWDKRGVDWNPHKVALQYERHLHQALRTKNRRKPSTRNKHNSSVLRNSLRLQKSALRAAFKPYPLVINDEFLRVFLKHMKQQQPHHYKLYPDTLSTLSKLANTYKLGLISNRSNIDLTRVGLSKHFTTDQLITPHNSKSRKPSARIFRYALAEFGVRPSEAVMIGDSWKNDIIGATTAGLDAIWLKRGKGGGVMTGDGAGDRNKASAMTAYRKLGRKKLLIIKSLEQLLDIL